MHGSVAAGTRITGTACGRHGEKPSLLTIGVLAVGEILCMSTWGMRWLRGSSASTRSDPCAYSSGIRGGGGQALGGNRTPAYMATTGRVRIAIFM